ncbi:MAG TPA: ubiquitin-like domain-containing protein, partial [Candidatus Lokiarchaeia archaeon]
TIGPGEKRQKLTVDDSNNVDAVKKTVGNIFGLDPDDFHLSSGGVTMDENTPLSSYNLSNGDEVLLIPASTAG